jgi:predicted nuclease of predicted toxin-antitoxin system
LVITNDEDFYRFAGVWGFPPKVLMLRTGNQSTRFLGELLRKHFTDIQALVDSPESGVLELY